MGYATYLFVRKDGFVNNIVNELVEKYIKQTVNTGFDLSCMEKYAKEHNVPIIQKEVASFLKVLLKIHKPKRILEVGTAIGYSSILFALSLDKECQIITVERNEEMIKKATENIKKFGLQDNITIIDGDAKEKLKEIDGNFDMIFLDAAKGQYKIFFDIVIDKLDVGGLLISDNVLYKGMIASDEFLIKRKKTIAKRMREYLDYICNCNYLDTSLVPIGDGIALSYKKEKR
ncbi:Predicted O-methyltransferase YrrM [Alkalithermobacter thermoalcaliphilus JW-YL-7 = DSM 7308]|uniref:tRNA 5-hydroxyuridine methyltransferase n=1 Tax=Alkalithermobacter thermoalcaliphilus JW-YL-7 = DSM 7308 TaxID=1121328 RepID=A0A150FQ16_CLOPD|nr:O-methyltransferase family 3 [[Clostridium] paradoxum JW-YL-7 = DSM 7308]SHK65389.1 Predicted O-methyltransferase YrrM [[Clostridium] paradoxum JW-YL-7 = DSM 7308]